MVVYEILNDHYSTILSYSTKMLKQINLQSTKEYCTSRKTNDGYA